MTEIQKLYKELHYLKNKIKNIEDAIKIEQSNCNHKWEHIGNNHNDDVYRCTKCLKLKS